MESPAEPAGDADNPAFWETRYRAGDTPWDKGEAHPEIVRWMGSASAIGNVLVPGCGTGCDARALATAATHVTAIDIAPLPIERAQAISTEPNVTFHQANFFDLPEPWRKSFDWVVEHTCFCAIDPASRKEYVQAAHAALRPEGRLFAIFFLNPDNDGQGPPFEVSEAELETLFGTHFDVEAKWRPQSTFPGRENREQVRVLRRLP